MSDRADGRRTHARRPLLFNGVRRSFATSAPGTCRVLEARRTTATSMMTHSSAARPGRLTRATQRRDALLLEVPVLLRRRARTDSNSDSGPRRGAATADFGRPRPAFPRRRPVSPSDGAAALGAPRRAAPLSNDGRRASGLRRPPTRERRGRRKGVRSAELYPLPNPETLGRGTPMLLMEPNAPQVACVSASTFCA